MVAKMQNVQCIMDSVKLCKFTLFGRLRLATIAIWLSAVTGWDVTIEELIKVGIRRINLMRTFNAREGFTRKEDTLPEKFFKPLGGSGPTAGMAVGRDEF